MLGLATINGCTSNADYTRSGETKYRLNNVKLIVQNIQQLERNYEITSMDDVIDYAVKHGLITSGEIEMTRNDAWGNPITIISNGKNSGVIVSSGPDGAYEAGKGDDISLAY